MESREIRSGPPLPLSTKARRTREQPISFLIETALHNPGLINFAAGLVDPRTLPVAECLAITQKLFSEPHHARTALQYDTTLGLRALRQKLVEHIAALDDADAASLGYGPEHIVITTGSQQALYLVGDVMIDPGDIVIAGNPSYFVYTGTLQSLDARVMSVPMDEDGMDVDAVAALLERLDREGRLPRVKMIYCTSFFDNPTGVSLSLARRERLVDIVRSYASRQRILIQEDAAYRELRYDGPPIRSIKSMDPHNQFTILSQTFSKPFAPGLKLGYTAMPADLLHAVLQQKGNHDFGSSNLAQHIALESLRNGSYDKHVQVLMSSYRAKRDAMLAALSRHIPPDAGVTWGRPLGGLYVWVTLPPELDASREGPLFQAAVAAGVLYVPGDYCFQPDENGFIPKNHIRLSFGQVDPAMIEPGIQRLAGVVAEQARKNLAVAS